MMSCVCPRFSVRLLLIAFAILSALLYLSVVRPTAVASRFIRAIEEHNYNLAASMLDGGDIAAIATNYSESTSDPELVPHSWSDIWHVRRSITVNSYAFKKYHNRHTGKEGFKTIYQQTSAFESGPFRVRLIHRKGIHVLSN
jgi:hypothetical protein